MGRPDIFFCFPSSVFEKFLRWHRLSSLCGPAWRAGTPALPTLLVPKFNLGTSNPEMPHLHTAPWLPELTRRL